jgi:hypothetical protein
MRHSLNLRATLLVVACVLLPSSGFADYFSDTLAAVDTDSIEAATTETAAEPRERRSRSCKQRLNQLVMYDDRTLLAKQQGNLHWEEATWRHISYLEGQLEGRCPELYKRRMADRRAVRAARWTKEAVKTAAEIAKAWFTGGLY